MAIEMNSTRQPIALAIYLAFLFLFPTPLIRSAEAMRAWSWPDCPVPHLWDGQNEIGSLDASNNLTQLRVLGLGLGNEVGAAVAVELRTNSSSAWNVYVPVHDHRGNVVTLINRTNGVVAAYYRYSAFGEVQSFGGPTGNPWLFSSKRFDSETGLTYFGRRYYDPLTGRFISADPLGFIDGANRYLYGRANPILFVDPSGLLAKDIYQDGFYSPLRGWAARLDEIGMKSYSPALAFYLGLQSELLQLVADVGTPAVYVNQYQTAVNNTSLVIFNSLENGDSIVFASAQGLSYAAGNILGYTPFIEGVVGVDIATGQNIEGVDRFTRTAAGTGQLIMTGVGLAASYNPASQSANLVSAPAQNTVTRYVGATEAQIAQETGFIPNVNRAGQPKIVFVTPEAPVASASQAESIYQIGRLNPMGASATPTHVIVGNPQGVNFVSGGNVAGGTQLGTELLTTERIPVISVRPIGGQ